MNLPAVRATGVGVQSKLLSVSHAEVALDLLGFAGRIKREDRAVVSSPICSGAYIGI